MHFCFIIEAQYRNETMPLAVARQLVEYGHDVDLLEPESTTIRLSDLNRGNYDAYVLKTVSDGPGFSILEAAEVPGIPRPNHSRALRSEPHKTVDTSSRL